MDKNTLLKKLSEFSIGPILGALISLISTPLFTYFISPDEYGRASMFSVALSVMELIVILGMDQAYAKRYYEAEDRSRLFVNAVFPSVVLVALVELVIFFMRTQVSVWLFDTPTELGCVYSLMAILPALAVDRFVLLGIRMDQRGKLYSFLSLLLKCLILLITVLLFFSYEKSFRSVVWGTVAAELIYAILLIYIQRNNLHIRLSDLNTDDIKRLLRFGLPLVPTTIIGWVLSGMDKVMLRTLCDYSSLGLYEVAAKVAAVLSIIQACFTTFWIPVAHQWNSEGVETERFVKVGRVLTCVMSVVFVGVLLLKDLVFLLFERQYSDAAMIVPFLLFTPIMYTISEVTVMGIYFKEKTEWTVIISAISAAANLLLNWLLIPRWGGVGAAIATGISYIIFFWCRTLLSRRLWFKFPVKDYIFVTLLLLIAAAVNSLVSGWAVYGVNVLCIGVLLLYFNREALMLWHWGWDILKSLLTRKDNEV